MNKTTSIHIKGFPFIMEEIAYSRLENYLNRLKSALGGQEGADEIIEDIELRIAELLNAKLTQFKQVIDDHDIIDVLNTLGDPSDYAENDGSDPSGETDHAHEDTKDHRERRLYRDTESGYIGGVCAGLAGYFNIDPTIIRLIWAAAFFLGGVGLFFYLILWIIIPKATSSIDRLRMKGKPINVDTVKEEVERAAKNVSDKSKHFANELKNDTRFREGISTFKKIVRAGFGIFLLFIGISALTVFITLVFGTPQFLPAATDSGFLSVNSFAKLIFNEPVDNQLAWMSFYISSLSFVIFFLLGGFATLFNLKNKWYRYVNFLLVIAGITGFILGVIVASRTGRDYAIPVEIEKNVKEIEGPSLTVLTKTTEVRLQDDYKIKRRNLWNIYISQNTVTEYGITIRYQVSQDSLYHVDIKKKAHAHTFDLGEQRAKNIEYDYEVRNDTLILPAYFTYPDSDKLRNQDVTVLISVPKGKTVSVAGEIVDLDKKYTDDDEDVEYERKKQHGKIRGDGTYRHKD